MSKYLHYFEVDGPKYERERKVNYKEPWASYVEEISEVKYNKSEEEKEWDEKLNTPLTFEILSDGVIRWKADASYHLKTIKYKKNDGEWESIKSAVGDSAASISVSAGDILQFKGDNVTYSYNRGAYNTFSGTTCQFNLKGNIMSLINSEDFASVTTLTISSSTFLNLFINCTGLTSSENLVLPATTLADYCYYGMFSGCTRLISAPELPATTLADYCYYGMFRNCRSLTQAPALPATTLTNGCYSYMFYDCTGLTEAPELPATTLRTECYEYMFSGCKKLTSAPELPATTLAGDCYEAMFYGCTSLTSAPELPATTLASYCYRYMFAGCTSLTTAPALPATTLATYCYYYMFYGCTSLTSAPELPATTLSDNCYYGMFAGCTNLNYIKCLATNISATNSHNNWVSGVASSGTFVKAASMTDWTTGINGIPNNWTVQDAS